MKKIIISLVAILIFKIGFSQNGSPLYPITQNLGSSSSLVDVKGGQRINGAFVLGHFVDTAAANAIPYVKNFANGLITTDTSLVWLRSYNAEKWLLMPTQGRIVNGDTIDYLVYVYRPPGQLNVYGKFFNGVSTYERLMYTDSIGSGGGSSYTFPYSVVAPGNAIQLENDTTANPANYFYGRNSAGRRGWYPQSGITGVNIYNSNGTLTGNRTVNGNYNGFEMSNISSLNIGIDDNAGMTGGINIGGDNADNDYHIRTIGSVGESGIYGYRSENKLYSVTAGSDSSFVQTDGENGISIKAFDGSLKIPLLNATTDTTGKSLVIRNLTTGLLENIDPALIGGGSGTVTSVATNNGTGITGGTITGSGTLAIDTANTIATRLQVQHRIDSLAALKQRKINYLDSSFKLTNDSLLWRDYINIKSLGAVGDGSTDNLAVFIAAVATGRNIFVPEGNFRVSAFFTLGDDQSIFGLGSKSIISTTANNRIMYIGDRCLVSGLHFKGSGKSAGLPFQTGILLYDAVGWRIDNCMFENFSGDAVQNGGGGIFGVSMAASNSDGGVISNCYFYNNNAGLNLAQRAEYVAVSDNLFGSNTVGIGLGAGNITITGNNIHNNTTGIKSFAGTNDAHSTITGNLINHNTFPLDINDVAYNVGNSFSNNMIYFGAIKITNSNNIRFQGGTISSLDSIHLNNSRFLRLVNVDLGPYYLGGDIPINKYNNSDDIEILGGVRRDSATATPYIKMIREDSIFFKLPTETKKAFFLMMDAYGHLVKVDSTGIGGSGISAIGAINSQTKSANGAVISGTDLVMQTVDATYPGLMTSALKLKLDSLYDGDVQDSVAYNTITGAGLYDSVYVYVYNFPDYVTYDSTLVALITKVTASSTTTFTNKTFDADGTGNSITNIENADIKSGAAIDATKIADGTVTSTEFQYINTLSSNVQTQINALPTASSTTTFTNKRWTARVGSTTSSATPTINTDNVDIYKLTAQTVDISNASTNLTGSPNDGDIFEYQITGTATRNITWGTSFVSSTVTLPAATSSTATLTVIFQYYTTSSYGNNKWVCVNSY